MFVHRAQHCQPLSPTSAYSAELLAHADGYHDPEDDALFAAAKAQYCESLDAFGVTHETCRSTICPSVAAMLEEVPPNTERPGEAAALCPGREATVLKFRQSARVER